MGEWFIVGMCVIGILIAVNEFLKTPADKRFRLYYVPTLEERLAACTKNAEAVIIKADRALALRRFMPVIIWLILQTLFMFWSKFYKNTDCALVVYFNSLYMIFGVPLLCLIFCSYLAHVGIKTLKTGYYPPLDSAVFRDELAKKGLSSKTHGWGAVLALPLMMILFCRSYLEMQNHFDSNKLLNPKIALSEISASCKK